MARKKSATASHLVVFAAKNNLSEEDVDAHLQNVAKTQGVPVESPAQFRGMLVGLVKSMDEAARNAFGAESGFHSRSAIFFSPCAVLLGIDACPMGRF